MGTYHAQKGEVVADPSDAGIRYEAGIAKGENPIRVAARGGMAAEAKGRSAGNRRDGRKEEDRDAAAAVPSGPDPGGRAAA